MHTLVSDTHKVVVNSLGAELTSFHSIERNEEIMWRADPAYWSGIAPILFPIVGELRGGQMRHAGKSFAMQRHGLVRKREFDCQMMASNKLKCVLQSDEGTLEYFPWRFNFSVTYTLDDSTLHIDYAVENLDAESMLFNLGSHPAFELPLQDKTIEDYRITFNRPEKLQRLSLRENLLVRETVPFELEVCGSDSGCNADSDLGAIRLSADLFNDDALVFTDINSSLLTLEYAPVGSRTSEKIVSIDTGGAPHLGIWAKPGAPYVCIEPWWGHADFEDASGEFCDKDSIQTLAAGETFHSRLAIAAFADR